MADGFQHRVFQNTCSRETSSFIWNKSWNLMGTSAFLAKHFTFFWASRSGDCYTLCHLETSCNIVLEKKSFVKFKQFWTGRHRLAAPAVCLLFYLSSSFRDKLVKLAKISTFSPLSLSGFFSCLPAFFLSSSRATWNLFTLQLSLSKFQGAIN